jgi:hypothetical protein
MEVKRGRFTYVGWGLRLTQEVRGGNLERAPVRTCELQATANAWSDYALSGCRQSPDR